MIFTNTRSRQLWLCPAQSSKRPRVETLHHLSELSQNCISLQVKKYFLTSTVSHSKCSTWPVATYISWQYLQEFGSSVFRAALWVAVNRYRMIPQFSLHSTKQDQLPQSLFIGPQSIFHFFDRPFPTSHYLCWTAGRKPDAMFLLCSQ